MFLRNSPARGGGLIHKPKVQRRKNQILSLDVAFPSSQDELSWSTCRVFMQHIKTVLNKSSGSFDSIFCTVADRLQYFISGLSHFFDIEVTFSVKMCVSQNYGRISLMLSCFPCLNRLFSKKLNHPKVILCRKFSFQDGFEL